MASTIRTSLVRTLATKMVAENVRLEITEFEDKLTASVKWGIIENGFFRHRMSDYARLNFITFFRDTESSVALEQAEIQYNLDQKSDKLAIR